MKCCGYSVVGENDVKSELEPTCCVSSVESHNCDSLPGTAVSQTHERESSVFRGAIYRFRLTDTRTRMCYVGNKGGVPSPCTGRRAGMWQSDA